MDDAEKWLRQNDIECGYHSNWSKLDYPFHSKRQDFLRVSKEIPESNFNGRHTRKISLGNGNYKIDTKERPADVLQYLK